MVTYQNAITGRIMQLPEAMPVLDRSTKWQRVEQPEHVEQPAESTSKRKRRKDDE